MELSERIAALRSRAGLSQSDLAERLEVSRQSVSKWETGASVPDLDKLIRLSEVFGVSLDMLVLGKEAAEAPTSPEAPVTAEELAALRDAVEQRNRRILPRHIVGAVLLCIAVLVCLPFLMDGFLLEGFLWAIPLVVSGVLCLLLERPGFWCLLAVLAWWIIIQTFFMA